ncbi:zinc-binding protein A33-like isoform X2 [Acipenser ruthenus]|uniref:zinc-binding protein A33-like isoform X2 n=1 Tax=Acipenser ruthenus TaxID=7906 RepID=UPI00274138FC|nr:zinc-binding protein A33-like isoform X2 [Acipenser ruthenus]
MSTGFQNKAISLLKRTLQKIAESFRKEQHSKRCETSAGTACDVHGGKLKLFCLNEGETFCEDCTSEHEDHKHVSVQEAVKGYKKDIETALEPMNLKIQKYQAFKTQCVNLEDHIQKQAQQTEGHIKEEFEKLHQFLRDEEKARIAALRGEEEQKRRIMKEKIEHISKIISSMSETMTAIDHEMKTEDLVFLKTYRKTKKRAKWTLEDPQCVSGALIDVAEHLGSLKYKVWEKMLGIVQYTPVTLDPNTAAPWLVLSEDLTSMTDSSKKHYFQDNPERFDCYSCVLGSEGFTSGKHCWDVEVGNNTEWVLGVVKESANRKEKIILDPGEGFWAVALRNEDGYSACTKSHTKLPLEGKPQKIRVQLDYGGGKVSFFDASNMTPIYSFTDLFSERIFPYFSFGLNENQTEPLKICPMTLEVKVELPSI